jgi:hypothetical protein
VKAIDKHLHRPDTQNSSLLGGLIPETWARARVYNSSLVLRVKPKIHKTLSKLSAPLCAQENNFMHLDAGEDAGEARMCMERLAQEEN